jgi:hypothetical protein
MSGTQFVALAVVLRPAVRGHDRFENGNGRVALERRS